MTTDSRVTQAADALAHAGPSPVASRAARPAPQRMTLLLALLAGAAGVVAVVCYLRLADLRGDAQTAYEDLDAVRREVAEIRRWKQSPGRAAAVAMDSGQINQRLRDAATAAGLADAPSSEPYNPTRLGNTDYSETLIGLRFEPLTLRQLTTFLAHLSQVDPSSRAKSIELRPPEVPPPGAPPDTDVWTADVGVAHLTYTPQRKGGAEEGR